MSDSEIGRLLSRVAGRQHVAALAGRCYVAVLIVAGVYAAVLLVSRLFGVIPDVFEWYTLLVIPAAAMLAALLVTRGRGAAVAARQVDTRMGTKDLFLTTALLDTAPGEYQILVRRDALAKARSIRPATVVPFDPWARTMRVVAVLLVLFAAVTLKFQLDPFGKEKARQLAVDRTERLKEQKKATAVRAKQLAKRDLTAENSERIALALEALKRDLKLMKPDKKDSNLKALQEQKANIGQMWQDRNKQKLADALSKQSTAQRFGQMETAKTRQWKQQMAAGNTAGLRQELSELQAMAKQISESGEGQKKEALKQELDKRLSELADFTSDQGTPKELNEALSRAMQQLDMASMPGMSQEGMKATGESLKLAMLEMGAMDQSMRDFESLEQALDALRMAQALNNMGGLDGEGAAAGAGEGEGLGGYAEYYARMMAQMGAPGQGAGMGDGQGQGVGQGTGKGGTGGQGQGQGGVLPEDPSAQTAHKTEKAPTKLTAGRILMQWKTNEKAAKGEVKHDYTQALADLNKEVSEAIVQEEVPPGLHDTIMRYFDTIEQSIDKSAAK